MILEPPGCKIQSRPGDQDLKPETLQTGVIKREDLGRNTRTSESNGPDVNYSKACDMSEHEEREEENPVPSSSYRSHDADIDQRDDECSASNCSTSIRSVDKRTEMIVSKQDSMDASSTKSVRSERTGASSNSNKQHNSQDHDSPVSRKKSWLKSLFSRRTFGKRVSRAKNAKRGSETIVTGYFHKENKNSPIGITFFQNDDFGPIVISGISAGGPFSKTCLKPGLEVVSVNGKSVRGMSAKEAITILEESVAQQVTVDARPLSNRNGDETLRLLDVIPEEGIIPEENQSSNEETGKQAIILGVTSEFSGVEVTTSSMVPKEMQYRINNSLSDESNHVLKLTSFVSVDPSSSNIASGVCEDRHETASMLSRLLWDVGGTEQSLPHVESLMGHSKPSEIEFAASTGKSTTASMSTERRMNSLFSTPTLSSIHPSSSMDSSPSIFNFISRSSITSSPMTTVESGQSRRSNTSRSTIEGSKMGAENALSEVGGDENVVKQIGGPWNRDQLPPLHDKSRQGSTKPTSEERLFRHSSQGSVKSVRSTKSACSQRNNCPSLLGKPEQPAGNLTKQRSTQNNEGEVSDMSPHGLQPSIKESGSATSSKSKSGCQQNQVGGGSDKSRSSSSSSVPQRLTPMLAESNSVAGSTKSRQSGVMKNGITNSINTGHAPNANNSPWHQSDFCLRSTPNDGIKICGIRYDQSGEYLWEPTMQMDPINLPINNGKEKRGEALVIDFQTRLFTGSLLLRIRGSKADQSSSDRATYSLKAVVRGKFKRVVSFTEIITGSKIGSSAQNAFFPHWAVESSKKVLQTIAPEFSTPSRDDELDTLAPLGSSPRIIVVEDGVTDLMGDRREEPTIRENTLLEKAFPLETSQLRAHARKKAFDQLVDCHARHPMVKQNKTYTFEFVHRISCRGPDSPPAASPGIFGDGIAGDYESSGPWHIVAAVGSQKLWSFELWNRKEIDTLE